MKRPDTKRNMPTTVGKKAAEPVIAPMRERIDALDQEIMGEVVGVAQAIGELRKTLSKVSACLDSRVFYKASSLGYGPVAEMFVFLQRTLGGLQGLCGDKEALVSEVAMKLGCAYEDALPHVDALMKSPHPLSEEERGEIKRRHPEFMAELRARIAAMGSKTEGSRAPRKKINTRQRQRPSA